MIKSEEIKSGDHVRILSYNDDALAKPILGRFIKRYLNDLFRVELLEDSDEIVPGKGDIRLFNNCELEKVLEEDKHE